MAAAGVEEDDGGRNEEGAGRVDAGLLEAVGDCDGGGAAEHEAASELDAERKPEDVEATEEEEGPGGGLLEEEELFWMRVWVWPLLLREYV